MRKTAKSSLSFLLASLIIVSFLIIPSSDVFAEFGKLKDSHVGIKITGEDYFFDEPEEVDSGGSNENASANGQIATDVRHADNYRRLKIWTHSASWAGKAIAQSRGIHWKDFTADAKLPPGSTVTCDLELASYINGYVNDSHFALGECRYYLRMDMGLLLDNKVAWDSPDVNAVLLCKTDDPGASGEWVAQMGAVAMDTAARETFSNVADGYVAYTTGSAGAGFAAGMAVGLAGTLLDLTNFLEDMEHIEFKIDGNPAFKCENISLEVGKDYRVFTKFKARTTAVAILAGTVFVYTDFYGHAPYPSYAEQSAKDYYYRYRGFNVWNPRIEKVNQINFPKDYTFPILILEHFWILREDGSCKVAAQNFEPREIEILTPEGEPIYNDEKYMIDMGFINKGTKKSPPIKVQLYTTENGEKYIDLPGLEPGQMHKHSFDYTFKKTGRHNFTIDIPGKELDEYLDLWYHKYYEVNVGKFPRCDLEIIPESVKIERKDDVERLQTTRPVVVSGAVLNKGNLAAENVIIVAKFRNEEIFRKEVGKMEIDRQNKFLFEFTPEQSGRLRVDVLTEPDEPEWDKKNNTFDKYLDIQFSKVNIKVEKEDFHVNPEKPKENQQVRFDVSISNAGNIEAEKVRGAVYVAGEKIKDFQIDKIEPGEKTHMGDLVWRAKQAGRYSFEVRFEEDQSTASKITKNNFATFFEVILSEGWIEGVDAGIDSSSIHYDDENERISFTIYNRGTKSASGRVDLYIVYGNNKMRKVRDVIFSLKANSRKRRWVEAPTGNFKYKLVLTVTNGADADSSNNEYTYICPEFTPDKIGPNIEIVAVALLKNNPAEYTPPRSDFSLDEKVAYTEDGKAVFLIINVFVANTGNVPCEYPDFEAALFNKKYPGEIPEFKPYSDKKTYTYVDKGDFKWIIRWMIAPFSFLRTGADGKKISRIIGFTGQRTRNTLKVKHPESGKEISKVMEPAYTRNLLFERRFIPYFNAVAFFKGDYDMKVVVDPQSEIAGDVDRNDNGINIKYSIPGLAKKLEPGKQLVFILRDDPKKMIRYYEKIAAGDIETGTMRNSTLMMKRQAEQFGIEKGKEDLYPSQGGGIRNIIKRMRKDK